MSGLAGLLAGRDAPAAYRWRAAHDAADVRRTAETAGWTFAAVDGWVRGTRAEVLADLGAALGFPATYGANLDALHDCLRDLPGPVVVLWDGWSTLARADERGFAAILHVLGRHDVAVLLRGDGPEVDLPLLD
ncbi:barstar family protein [Nocardioides panacisoli]|uniref:barstar family protein n=1 Tax=Nocardioides panacisoli TaxID=627624 RepID=UPI001C62DF6E|nr:barstar family protein [Nocardioides panacisoli]